MTESIKRHLSGIWNHCLRDLLVVSAFVIPFKSSIADWNHVPTGSMKPTILEGDHVWVNKLAYDLKVPLTTWHLAEWSNPGRGDIVVFDSPKDEVHLVKRVIGLPGETVELRDNHLYINGAASEYAPLPESVLSDIPTKERSTSVFAQEQSKDNHHAVMLSPNLPARRSFGPVTVPEGHYLCLGDNRDNSADSRYFGFVERKRITGKVTSVVLSMDYDHYHLPRMDRWFHPLQ